MRRAVIILVVAIVLATVGYYFLVFNPQSSKIKDVRTQADTEEGKAKSLEGELSRLQALQRQAPELRARAEKVDIAIPSDPQLAQFILQVQDSATTSGVDWLSISATPPSAPAAAATAGASKSTAAPVSNIAVSMQVTGGYFQVQDFLARLENLQRAVKIGGISLGPGPHGIPNLSASLNMAMFVAPGASTLPGAGVTATATPAPTTHLTPTPTPTRKA